jgi:hypothetical protein
MEAAAQHDQAFPPLHFPDPSSRHSDVPLDPDAPHSHCHVRYRFQDAARGPFFHGPHSPAHGQTIVADAQEA